jgi:serine/threonine-protein kinase
MSFLCPSCHAGLPDSRERAVLPCPSCGVAIDLRDVATAPGAPGLSPEHDLSGKRLGDYQLSSKLGSGGMGIVYAATGPAGEVAIKVLARAPASDPGLRARFRRAAEALLGIEHPAIVRVYAQGEEDGVAWYAMERLSGEDLAHRLKRGPLAPAEALSLARQLLSALGFIHKQGLIHRDIKPSNVLLFPSGAKLCDFGVARLDGSNTLTESMAIVGSLRYITPEQRSGKTTPASDLYSLGVLLFEACTGILPEEAPLTMIQPRRLRGLIGRLLAQKPVERPASAAVALELLGPAEPPSRRGAVAAAAALLLTTGAGLAVALRPDPPKPKPPAVVVAADAPVLGPMKPEIVVPLPEELATTSTPAIDAAIDAQPPEPRLQNPGPKPQRVPTKGLGKSGGKPKAVALEDVPGDAPPQAAAALPPTKGPAIKKKPVGKPRPRE